MVIQVVEVLDNIIPAVVVEQAEQVVSIHQLVVPVY
jgi:hypothetical protein